jgi:hypothetical protein
LPAGLVERIDLAKPVVAIVLVAAKKPGDSGTAAEASAKPVMAFALKDPSKAGFDAFVASAGKVVESSKDAVRVQPAGDGAASASPAWMLSRDGAVVMAETVENLAAGGSLALEARKVAGMDLRLTLMPEGIARSSGTTLKEALAKARTEFAAEQARAQAALAGKNPKMQATAGKMAESIVGYAFDAAGDTNEVRVALSIDVAKGLSTSFELVPRPGSPFAKTVGSRKAYAVDPALLAGGPPAALWSMGDITFTRSIFETVRGPLLEMITPEAERAKAAASIDTLFDALAGPFSARFTFDQGPKLAFAYDVIYTLKPGTDGKKLMADLDAMVKAPWLGQFFNAAFQGMMKVKIASKREGDALVMQVSFDTKKMPPEMRKQMKGLPFLDGTPIEGRTVVVGDKMIVSTGPGAQARLAALLAAPAGAAPSGDLAAALAESKGDDALYYADLAAMLKPIIALAASGALAPNPSGNGPNPMAMAGMAGALLENAHLATWGSYRGGDTATLGWRIPMSTFESVGTIVRGAMGGR